MTDPKTLLTAYEKERNRFIPEAERCANKQFGVKFKGGSQAEREEWTSKWNRTYHNKMNKLWEERQ